MSLTMLLPPEAVTELLSGWPDKPQVCQLPQSSPLPRVINGPKLTDYLTTGCVPADMVNVIDNGALRHPASFTAKNNRLDPARISHWMQSGCTVQARKMDLWFPPMAKIVAAIRQETGCDGYVTGFITPGGGQGLQYHWDQTAAVVAQLEGRKTWEIWRPIVEQPYQRHLDSVNDGNLAQLIPKLAERGPDIEIDLRQGDVLILPRGWIHNPHSLKFSERSVHITFVLEERTPQWIAERLARSAVADPRLRRGIPAGHVTGPGLTAEVIEARDLLMDYLRTVDPVAFSTALRELALSERGFA